MKIIRIILIFTLLFFITHSIESSDTVDVSNSTQKNENTVAGTMCSDTAKNLANAKNLDTNKTDTLTNGSNKQELTFWQKYVETTLAVLGAAAITIILFSVRSK